MKITPFAMAALVTMGCGSTIEHYTEDTGTDAEDTDVTADTAVDGMDVPADTIHTDSTPADTAGDTVAFDTAPDPFDVPPDTMTDPVDVPIDSTPDTVLDTSPDPIDVISDDVPIEPVPEVCTNGIDDDIDGRTDCMDSDCLAAEACAGTCYPISTIACSGTVSSSNTAAGATDRIDEYSCASWVGWEGSEVAYRLNLTMRRGVTMNLTGLTADMDLFLLSGTPTVCDADDCLTRSIATDTNPELISTTLDPGTYYILVDGYSGATSPFTLTVTCAAPENCSNGSDDDGDGLADCADSDCDTFPACVSLCSPAGVLSCGSSLTGNTSAMGATDVVDAYSCTTWPETGNEFTYSFASASPTAMDVTFTIDNLSSTYLDLFVIQVTSADATCNPMQCTGSSTTDDSSDSVSIRTTAGSTYFVVVDGYAETTGTYRITATCP